MKTLAGLLLVAALVAGGIYLRRETKTRDLARDVCENVIDKCGPLADPDLAPKRPDLGGCVREFDRMLYQDHDPYPQSVATCLADAESCEAIVGCGFTEGFKARRARH